MRRMKILKIVIATVASIVVALYFAFYLVGLPLQTYDRPQNLPVKIETALSPEEAKSKLVAGLAFAAQQQSKFYKENGFRAASGFSTPQYDRVDRAHVKVDDSVRLPADLYDHLPSSTIAVPVRLALIDTIASSHYYTATGPVSYIADFAVLISETTDSALTRVSVRSFNSRVYNGKEFNGHVLWFISKSQAVEPALEEEYLLLRYVAHLLGDELPTLESYK